MVVAAGMAVAPRCALAQSIEVTDSMAGDDGVIALGERGADYEVNENLTHPLLINVSCTLTFNDGASLTVPADAEADAIKVVSSGSKMSTVTIKNAKVVQNSPSYRALYLRETYFTLEDSDFTSAGPTCVEGEVLSYLTVNSGSLSSTSTASGPLIKNPFELTINGGTFTPSTGGITLTKGIAASATVNGGTFTCPDIAARLADGKIFEKTEAGAWTVVDDNGAPDDALYRVAVNGRTVAYFADKDEAEAFSAKADGRVAEITYAVSFDADGGTPEPESQDVIKGGKATEPATPCKKGYEFVKWVDTAGASDVAFDFDSTIAKPYNLKAVYKTNDTTYNVTFHANGGVFADGTAEKTLTFTYGETLSMPADPTISGKYFDGWTTKDGAAYDTSQAVTDELDLYASWVGAAATCDGVEYGTLAEALGAATDDSVVTLLRDVEVDSALSKTSVKNLTIDLGGYTLSTENTSIDEGLLTVADCDDVAIKNGKIRCANGLGLTLYECDGFRLSSLDIQMTTSSSHGYAVAAGVSSGTIESGIYSSKSQSGAVALYDCPSVTIENGTFTCIPGSDDDPSAGAAAVLVSNSGWGEASNTLTVKGGTFTNYILPRWRGDGEVKISISGGTFGSDANRFDLADGYAMLVRKGAGERYEVVPADDEGVPTDACWSVSVTDATDESYNFVIYFEDEQDARAYASECESVEETVVVSKLRYTVSFESQKKIVSTKTVRAGKAVGDLPEGEKVAGYTFDGWYAGDTKVDATYVPADDVTLVAKWVKSDSGDDDTPVDPDDDPSGDTDDGSSDGSGNKGADDKDNGKNASGSDKELPQTGDDTNAFMAFALAGLGALALAKGAATKE